MRHRTVGNVRNAAKSLTLSAHYWVSFNSKKCIITKIKVATQTLSVRLVPAHNMIAISGTVDDEWSQHVNTPKICQVMVAKKTEISK